MTEREDEKTMILMPVGGVMVPMWVSKNESGGGFVAVLVALIAIGTVGFILWIVVSSALNSSW